MCVKFVMILDAESHRKPVVMRNDRCTDLPIGVFHHAYVYQQTLYPLNVSRKIKK